MDDGSPVEVTFDELALAPEAGGQPGLVTRQRLLEALLADRRQTVVFLSAPAGAGKSTLAQQWARRDPRPRSTVAVTPALADPAAFARALVKALESVGPPARKTRALTSSTEPAFSSLLPPALTLLASNRGTPYVLVIDDLHLVTHPASHALLAALIDGVPEGSQVAMLSREPAPRWVAVARARGSLLELGPDDLAFSVLEAIDLFTGMGLHVADHEVAKATEHAEGWAVALYLDALALRDRGGLARMTAVPIPLGSDRAILDYLRWQVLDPLDEDTRAFLRRTSVLVELVPALCDRIMDRTDSAAVLARLSASNRLVIELDSRRQRYRYHHLLAEALATELLTVEPEAVSVLHRRAASWFAEHDDLDPAVEHAKQSGDLDLVASLIWSGIGGCVASGRPDRLAMWLVGLTGHEIASDRWLSLANAWAGLQLGDLDRRERWAIRAEAHGGRGWRDNVASDPYAASLAVLVALIGRCTVDEMEELTAAAIVGLPPDSAFLPPAEFLTGVARLLHRDIVGASALLADAQRHARALDVPLIEADAISLLGLITLMTGDVAAGASLIAESAVLIDKHDLDRLATSAHTLTGLALAQTLLRDRDNAAATLTRARRLTAEVAGIAPWFAVSGRSIQARAAALQGDGPLARQLIGEARAALTPDLAALLTADLLAEAEATLQASSGAGTPATVLTAAEIRVLQFLPSHFTFRQIGEHLYLSGNTVKTHALAIYRKLGVSSRDEAVTRARQLGLVEGPVRD